MGRRLFSDVNFRVGLERRMRIAIMFRRETENERNQHKAEGLFFFGRQDEDFAAGRFGRVGLRLHLALGLT